MGAVTASMTFLLTAAAALIGHRLFRLAWYRLPRLDAVPLRVGRAVLVALVLVLGVVLASGSNAAVLGFLTGGVIGPLLLSRPATGPRRR